MVSLLLVKCCVAAPSIIIVFYYITLLIYIRLLQVSEGDRPRQLHHSNDALQVGGERSDRPHSCKDVGAKKVWVSHVTLPCDSATWLAGWLVRPFLQLHPLYPTLFQATLFLTRNIIGLTGIEITLMGVRENFVKWLSAEIQRIMTNKKITAYDYKQELQHTITYQILSIEVVTSGSRYAIV